MSQKNRQCKCTCHKGYLSTNQPFGDHLMECYKNCNGRVEQPEFKKLFLIDKEKQIFCTEKGHYQLKDDSFMPVEQPELGQKITFEEGLKIVKKIKAIKDKGESDIESIYIDQGLLDQNKEEGIDEQKIKIGVLAVAIAAFIVGFAIGLLGK